MADETMATQAAGAGEAQTFEGFTQLIKGKVKADTTESQTMVDDAVGVVLQSLGTEGLVKADIIQTIEAIIGELDERLSKQVNAIMHHEDFRRLEGSWRGLHHLVTNTETSEQLKIRVWNVGKNELAKSLKRYKGAMFDQSPIFKEFYEAEYGMFGGEPYGTIIADYEFDHSAKDILIMEELSKVGAAAHAPVITAAAPSLFRMESWQDLAKPQDLERILGGAEHAAWRSFRESNDSRYVALTMPRFLSREPYTPDTVEEFAFHEDTQGGHHDHFTWSNAAYAMGVNINRSFKDYGWCTSIRGPENGGIVEGLPVYTFPNDEGDTEMKCPTEIAISDRREGELSKLGLIGLLHQKNSNLACFFGSQTAKKPGKSTSDITNESEQLSARLTYLFASCRFAHYLKTMVRNWTGSALTRAQIQGRLEEWVLQYVDGDPDHSTQTVKSQKPLAKAEVVVEDMPGNPGYYSAQFKLMPHYQLEGMNITMSLVGRLAMAQG